jgi:hypothetical protein
MSPLAFLILLHSHEFVLQQAACRLGASRTSQALLNQRLQPQQSLELGEPLRPPKGLPLEYSAFLVGSCTPSSMTLSVPINQ